MRKGNGWLSMNDKNRAVFQILLLFLVALIIMLRQLMTGGYFSVIINDAFTFSSWAWQFTEALKEGIIYPRWTALNFWGYGSPTFILYSPLAYYLVAFINVFTGSVITAMNIAKFIALFLSSAGMFFLVREFYSEKIALLSASFYLVFPYNIVVFYLIGSFASVISLIWFPPIILFAHRYIKNRDFTDLLYAGACFGGLILTHLVSAYMFTLVMAAFIIYMSVIKERAGALIAVPLIITIGCLISAAYIFPLIYERNFINLQAFVREGGGFRFSFILPDLTGKLPSDHFWPLYYRTFVFHLFLFCILIVIFSLLQILRKITIKTAENVNAVDIFFLAVSFFSLFLLFGPSEFIWENFPFFKYIQFPVRWLNITAFAVVFLSASGFGAIENLFFQTKKDRYFFISVIFLICILLDFIWYINRVPAFPEKDLIPTKGENYATEHLPIWADIGKAARTADSKERVRVLGGRGEYKSLIWKSAERVIETRVDEPLTLRIRTFNFPGWTAYVDEEQHGIKTEEGTGAILIDIPPGKHKLELRFLDTPIRRYSKLISLVSFFSAFFLALIFRKRAGENR